MAAVRSAYSDSTAARRRRDQPGGGKARKLNPDGYVHARDAEEYRRLRDQAVMWQGATEQLLDRVGL